MTRRLCSQCRYCFEDFWGLKCNHPQVPPKDLANGERDYADGVRKYGKCGKEGELFEPKPAKVSWFVRKAWKLRRWLETRP